MYDITNMEEMPTYHNEGNTMDKMLSTKILLVVVHIERELI